jgi:Na+-transporting methylmalonyl-CoA/oxaloacetate decarboxylase gamma subunit
MDENIAIALQITLAGMGLVFAAILVLWLVMDLLVRLTAERRPEPAHSVAADEEQDRRRLAAALAVAVAVAVELEEKPNVMPLPPTALVSAWQAVTRSNLLDKRGAVR